MFALTALLSVMLTFPFGTAEATALSSTGGLTVEITVEVLEPASVVLIRGVGPVDELVARTMTAEKVWFYIGLYVAVSLFGGCFVFRPCGEL